jgi:hypothetical protein
MVSHRAIIPAGGKKRMENSHFARSRSFEATAESLKTSLLWAEAIV